MPRLSRRTILRILIELVEETFGESFRGNVSMGMSTSLREGIIGLDSVGILSVAGRINSFFNLHEVGTEDNLLRAGTLGDWVDLVDTALGEGVKTISFRTSGSTGEPKEVPHRLPLLWQEAQWLAQYFAGRSRVIATVSPKHIYGFLFTAMLPDLLDVPVVDGRTFDPHTWKHDLRTDDMIVSYPAFWRFLANSNPHFKTGAWGVSSTAPMPPELSRTLTTNGLDRVVEIYGATETAGVGYRADPGEPFTLFPFWEPESPPADQDAAGGSDAAGPGAAGSDAAEHQAAARGLSVNAEFRVTRLRRLAPQDYAGDQLGEKTAVEVMDELEWQGERRFVPLRRRDRAVQVAGTNVFPALIERRLIALPEVEDAHVRLMRPSEGERLKAIIVPDRAQPIHELEQRIRSWIEENLTAPERPVAIRYLRKIPTDEMGKRADWDVREPNDWD